MQIKQGADKNFAFYIFNQDGEVVKTTPQNLIFTAIKQEACANCSKIEKRLNNGITFDEETGKYTLVFYPEDTIGLEPGAYPFDIKIKRAGKQYFIVKQGTLKVAKSYTGVI